MKKRFISLLLASAMVITLTGCTNASDASQINTGNQTTEASDNSSSDSNAAVAAADETEVPATEDTQETESDEIVLGENLIPCGDFSVESSKWGMYRESGGSATYSANGKMKVRISSPGKKGHSVQIYCDGFELLEGGEYELSFDVLSDVERTIEWRIQVNGGDYHPYVSDGHLWIGPEETHISKVFIMEEASDPAPRLCFNLGDEKMQQGLEKHEIVIDNVCLKLINADNAKKVDLSVDERDININQVGYRPNDTKRAVVRGGAQGAKFDVIDSGSEKTVLSGTLTEGISKGASGDKVAYADFSDLTTPGKYYVRAEGVNGISFDFEIAEDVYSDTFDSICRMLYLQRCGMDLKPMYAGDFAHEACHTELATIYGTDETIDVSGGWHDAGDYGRYVVPAATTVADLMLAYEKYPEAFSDDSDIPESGNGIPDILDETRYELEWMLKMQAPDGGVYHKVTGLNFDGVVMPEDCSEKLYVISESKIASGDFAAAMYMAARVYSDIDPEFANKCMKAADKALPYIAKRLNESNYSNPPDVLTGEYPDGASRDEYLWALCEGYKTSKGTKYAEELKSFDYGRIDSDGLGWATMTEFAYYAYLTSDKPVKDMPYDYKAAFLECADELKDISLVESYGSSILMNYTWGSNMTICNNGIILLMADEINPDSDYIEAANNQLNYILGVNANSYCFVTGEGSLSPEHPHHRPSQTLGKAMPGMVIGGPDSNLEDPFAKTVLKGRPDAKCYVDNEQSYSCNEITIYWNSPLIYLMAGIMQKQ